MSVTIPTGYDIDLDLSGSLGSVGPVTLGPVTISGIPSDFSLDIKNIPKIQLGIDPLSVTAKVDLGLPAVTINPVSLNLAIKEIPSIRTHLPSDYCVGISILGIELFAFRFCGESQLITEPYNPNPCERCEQLLRGADTTTLTNRPAVGG